MKWTIMVLAKIGWQGTVNTSEPDKEESPLLPRVIVIGERTTQGWTIQGPAPAGLLTDNPWRKKRKSLIISFPFGVDPRPYSKDRPGVELDGQSDAVTRASFVGQKFPVAIRHYGTSPEVQC